MRQFNLAKYNELMVKYEFKPSKVKENLLDLEKFQLNTSKEPLISPPKKIPHDPIEIPDDNALKYPLADKQLDFLLKDEKIKLKDLLAKKKNPELLKTFQAIEKIEDEINLNKFAQQHPHLLTEYSNKRIGSLSKNHSILNQKLNDHLESNKDDPKEKLEIKTRLLLMEKEINDRFKQYQESKNSTNEELMKKIEKEWRNENNYKQIPIHNLEEKLKEINDSVHNYKRYFNETDSAIVRSKSELKQIHQMIVRELNERYQTILTNNDKKVKKNLWKKPASEKELLTLRKKVNKLREKYRKKYSLSQDDSLKNAPDVLRNEEYFRNDSKLPETDFQNIIKILNQNARKPDDLSNISKFIQDN